MNKPVNFCQTMSIFWRKNDLHKLNLLASKIFLINKSGSELLKIIVNCKRIVCLFGIIASLK